MTPATPEPTTPNPIDLDELQQRIARLDEQARRAIWLCAVAFEPNHTVNADTAKR